MRLTSNYPPAAPRFSPHRTLPETPTLFAIFALFCGYSRFCLNLGAFAALREIFALNQRLINQIGKALEEAVLVVWEVLGKDEHDELFSRIDHA
jgi:hypothetical protein